MKEQVAKPTKDQIVDVVTYSKHKDKKFVAIEVIGDGSSADYVALLPASGFNIVELGDGLVAIKKLLKITFQRYGSLVPDSLGDLEDEEE